MPQTTGRVGTLTAEEITTATDALADSARTVLEGIHDPAAALAQRVADIAAACLDMLVDDQHDGGDDAMRIVELNHLLRFHGYDELAYSDEDIAAITGEDRETLRQLVAARNAALAAEAQRVAAFAEIACCVDSAVLMALMSRGARSSPSRTSTRLTCATPRTPSGTCWPSTGCSRAAAPSPSPRPRPLRTAAAGEPDRAADSARRGR